MDTPNTADSNPYFLTTTRLGFRRWRTADLPLALSLWGDPSVTQLIGGPFSEEAIKKKLDREIATQASYGVQYWPIFLLDGNAHSGCAGLRPHWLELKVYELGFHLRPAYRGKGLAVEAGRAVVSYAFDTLGAGTLFAGHHPQNGASKKVLVRLGFQFTHEEFYAPTGLMHPSYILTRR